MGGRRSKVNGREGREYATGLTPFAVACYRKKPANGGRRNDLDVCPRYYQIGFGFCVRLATLPVGRFAEDAEQLVKPQWTVGAVKQGTWRYQQLVPSQVQLGTEGKCGAGV